LVKQGCSGVIVGIGTTPPATPVPNLRFSFEKINLLDSSELERVITNTKPKYCVHLASMSSVANSWREPVESFVNNTNVFLNLAESIRRCSPATRILSIGSSEQYGRRKSGGRPFVESDVFQPDSPYAIARCSQEWLAHVYTDRYELDIVMTRSFNHIGPGQSTRFAISNFAKAFARAVVTQQKSLVLPTGDLNVVRDFLDVRDAVRGYEAILTRSASGSVYNVCSGLGVKLRQVIDKLAQATGIVVETRTDESLVRPVEASIVIGSREALTNAFDWQPQISLDQSIADILQYWIQSERCMDDLKQ
tara:strand:- start:184 stop:1101 length:918 start_codon:yes stop_codon:yes gene_type:complete